MDDLEFRRQAYADPNNTDQDFLDKKNESIENEKFVEELKNLDRKITQAIQIEAPEGLAERIKLNQQLGEHAYRKKQMRRWFSIAASVLIVFGLVASFISTTKTNDLSQRVLSHVYDELYHLEENHHYSIARANLMLASYGGEFQQNIGSLRYVGKCEIAKQQGVHMILDGKVGPVTVMMMPETKIDKALSINDHRFQGSIEPTSRGSYAIIAEKGEELEQVKQTVNKNLKWRF